MSDREIPSVPITTLAGLTSLSDLLSELPIADSLPFHSNSHKSLLFHPRVAEEAKILLSSRDENLAHQLINAIEQTSSTHIELKKEYTGYVGSDASIISPDAPQLLQVVHAYKPNVFNTFKPPNLVNPNASSHYHAQPPTNISQNYSLQQPSSNHYDSSFNQIYTQNYPSDQTNYQQTSQQYANVVQTHPYYPNHYVGNSAESSVNSLNTPYQQQDMNDLLAPGSQLPQNLFNIPQINQVLNNSDLLNNIQIPHPDPFFGQTNLEQSLADLPSINSSSYNCIEQPNTQKITAVIVEQNHYATGMKAENHLPVLQKNNHQNSPVVLQIQSPINNNTVQHLKISANGNKAQELSNQQKVAPRNNEYLQQQQHPSPMQGSVAPEGNNMPAIKVALAKNNVASTSGATPSLPPLMTTFDLPTNSDNWQNFNLKKVVINVPKIKVSNADQQQLMNIDLEKYGIDKNSGDMFSLMKEDEKRAPVKRKLPQIDDKGDQFNQPKLRRIEKKLAPVLPKLSAEDLMKTNTYQRFISFMEKAFDQLDESEAPITMDDNEDGYECITGSLLSNISAEAAKLKARASIDVIPEDKLTLLVNYAMRSVHLAKNFSAGPDMADDLVADECLEKILSAIEAALLICNIYTSKDTKFLQEDNIDTIIKFVQFQLRETIFPSYDAVYTIETKKKQEKKKKTQSYQQKGITTLYTKIVELTKLLVKLFCKFHFVDTIIIHASSLGVEPFFVDNIETLQFVCLDLVTSIFQNEKYKHHRHNILNDILSSVDRLPHSKRNLRPYKLTNNNGQIQMMTALVLQLIQSSVVLPEDMFEDNKMSKRSKSNSEGKSKSEKETFVIDKYDTAVSIGGHFLQTFLTKCKSRASETDFRPLFENFIQDLLTTLNKPEWPAAELLLSLLGTLLVKSMADKSVEQSIRVVSLEYLGIVAARLRKDAVESRCKVKTIDNLIKCIKQEQEKEGEDEDASMIEIDPEEERMEFLQRILLDFLILNSQEENPVWNHARHFYLTLWYREIMQRKKHIAEGEKGYASRKKMKKRKKYQSESDSSDSDCNEVKEVDAELNIEIFRILEERKKYLLSKISPFKQSIISKQVIDLKTYLDYENANLIAQYLTSKRIFSQSFDTYLQKIILVVREPVVAIRTKAMKCLGSIVEVDQSILARKDMQIGVSQKMLDTAISVREAAVDLVGKYIMSDPDLIDPYYDTIVSRILDTGVSVRKRVIKILRDICVEYPEHNKIPDICVKLLRRVNDEENIQKLVMDVFMTMWFTPCAENDKAAINRKIEQIIDVELSSQEKGFHGLLKTVFEPKESKEDSKLKKELPPSLLRSCEQIASGLVDSIMTLEQSNTTRLVGCVTALHSLAQIRPQLLIKHAISLEPYLNLKGTTAHRAKFISMLGEILEQVVPLMEHPGEVFLSELESHLMVHIMSSLSQGIISSCIGCLGAVVNKLTKNYKLVRDLFFRYYYKVLLAAKERIMKDPNLPEDQVYHPVHTFRRSIYTVGLLMRYFNFNLPEVYGANTSTRLPPTICSEVFDTLFFLLNCQLTPVRKEILVSIGYFCVTNDVYLTKSELKDYYNHLLSRNHHQNDMKINVLRNIWLYLLEEEHKMTRNDKDWSTQSKMEDLKEMGDISSGMSSCVIQIYLKECLNCFLNCDNSVRVMAMRVVDAVLRQGLVHPVQIVPYLICLSTDPETETSHKADKHLLEIDKQYQGFVNMKSQAGISLSYELQSILQHRLNGKMVRGFRMPKEKDLEPPTAMNGYLYSLLRNTKPTRRALIQSITKQFDDQKTTLSFMLYLADNLAYFPYVVQDEPLYIIHQIDLLVSVTGTNLLQTFREGLRSKTGAEMEVQQKENPLEDEDDEEDKDVLYGRLPEDTSELQSCITSAQGCMLLLMIKQHLKEMYGINDGKISRYSPSESTKIYDKAMQRRHNSVFTPKATIAILKEDLDLSQQLTELEKRVLVDRYLDFKQLMIRLDPDDPDADDDEKTHSPVKVHPTNSSTLETTPNNINSINNTHSIVQNYNLTTPNVPQQQQQTQNVALPMNLDKSIKSSTISKPPRSKVALNKPSRQTSSASKKKKRRKLSSSEDEESDYSDDDD